jgi:hypothetical protein
MTLSPAPTRLPPPSHDPSQHALCLRSRWRGVFRASASAHSHRKNRQFDDTSSRHQYPTEPATSRLGSSARFNVDVGYVIIDVSLLRFRVATRGRGCRRQRVDFRQNKSTRPHNAQASTAGNATNSRGGREREVVVRQEAKTKVKTEVQTATMRTRLLVVRSTATQINNQPTTGASKCRGPFGEARAEGKQQSHQRLRCLRSRDQHCKKNRRHLSLADDRRWDDGRWCNRRRRRTIDRGAGGQGWGVENNAGQQEL